MNIMQKSILVLAPLSPYLTNLPAPTDTASHWSVEVAAGIGQMAQVSRDCNGNVISVEDYPYSEVAAAVRYTDLPLTASVSGGTTSAWMKSAEFEWSQPPSAVRSQKETKRLPYCVPMIGIDTKYVGMEVGYFAVLGWDSAWGLGPNHFLNQSGFPAGSLRLGNREKTHFSCGVARNLPLNSGGGFLDLGVATPVGDAGSRLFFGVGMGGTEAGLILMKGDLNLSKGFALTPRLSFGLGEGSEYGLSIGGRFQF